MAIWTAVIRVITSASETLTKPSNGLIGFGPWAVDILVLLVLLSCCWIFAGSLQALGCEPYYIYRWHPEKAVIRNAPFPSNKSPEMHTANELKKFDEDSTV